MTNMATVTLARDINTNTQSQTQDNSKVCIKISREWSKALLVVVDNALGQARVRSHLWPGIETVKDGDLRTNYNLS